MRGAANLCPLLAAEGVDPSGAMEPSNAAVVPVAIDAQQLAQAPSEDDVARLGALLQSLGSDLIPANDLKKTARSMEAMARLPSWAQSAVRLGCGGVTDDLPHKRSSHSATDVPPRKKARSFQKKDNLRIAAQGMDSADDELIASSQDTEGMDDDDEEEERLRATFTQEERVAENVDKYSDTLARLIDTVHRRSEENAHGDGEFGAMDIFVPQEVKTLVQSLKVLDKSGLIAKCDPDLLIALAAAMDRQVRTGLTLDVLGTKTLDEGDEEWKATGIDVRLISRVQSSLDVGICELVLMSTLHIDRRILSEDSIDNCAQLLTHVIQKLVLPFIDPTFVVTGASAKPASEMAFTSPPNEPTVSNGSVSARARNGARPLKTKHNKSAKKAMDRLLPVVCEFMEQLARLISSVKLEDRLILQFSSMVMKFFTLEFSAYTGLLQRSGMLILRAIFLNCETHRSLVLDELVSVMLHLPTTKRNLRTVKLAGSTDVVQMISTVVVALVQVSAATASTTETTAISSNHDPTLLPEDAVMDDEGDARVKPDRDSLERIDGARTSARLFVLALIRDCLKKNEERDNRVVLDNFLEDLLVMFGRPEWAGAQILLEVLSTSLANILNLNLVKDAKKLESQYSLTALSLVGRICASIKEYQHVVAHDPIDDEDSRAVYDEHEGYLRVVFENLSESNGDGKLGAKDIDRSVVLKHIVLTYLRNVRDVLSEDSRKLLVTQFVLENQTIGSAVYALSVWKSYWETKSIPTIDSSSKLACPQHDLAVRASMQVTVTREFGGMFDILISQLMALLSRGIPTFRARVMKALSGIVDVDPMLMADTAVRNAVSQCFLDEATSVRQAAVDLVGKYVTLQPLLLDRYFDMLCERLRDKGISVRKSVCKILRSYLTLPTTSFGVESAITEGELHRRSACMRHLVQRIGDPTEDDAVKNFIIDTFQESWFGAEFSSRQLSGVNGFDDEPLNGGLQYAAPPGWTVVVNSDGTAEGEVSAAPGKKKGNVRVSTEFVSPEGNVYASAQDAWAAYRTPMITPSSVVKTKRSKHDDTIATVATIIEVIQGMSTMDWLVALLKRLLYDDHTKLSAGKRTSRDRSDDISVARSRSEKIVACLIECLLRLKEGKELKGVTGSDRESQFLSCLKALSAFSEALPLLLSPHLEVVMAYINGDEKFSKASESKIQSLAVSMVSNEIAFAGRVTSRIASRLETDLKDLILRAPPSVVGSSIKCLASMSSHTKRPPTVLFNLLGQFFKYLDKFKNMQSLATVKAGAIASLQRALFAAGRIGGALDFDNRTLELPESTDPPFDQLVKGSIMDALYQVYSAFLKIPGNPSCTAKAVQGLGFLFMLRPRFLMQAQQEGLFDGLLQAPSHEVRLQTLTSLKELLQHEEQRLEEGMSRKKAQSKIRSKKNQVEGDQDGEGSLIGSVMQVQLRNVLELALEKNQRIRSEAVSCVAVLLTQGLISPLDCIPYLVALEADQVPSIRDLAHSQLVALHEKFPAHLHQPAVKGVFLSHTFQVDAFGSSTVYALDKEKREYALFGRLYTTCLRPVRTHRNMFLQSLISQFSDKGTVLSASNLQSKPLKTIEFLIFLAQFIATLPFDVEDEPLFIIYHINRYVTLKLGPTLQAMKKMFIALGVDAIDASQDDADLSDVDISRFLQLKHEGAEFTALLAHCCVGFAIHLLLRVKFFLKDTYGLDNEKCQTYQPGSATKATDQSLFVSEHSPPHVGLPSAKDLSVEHPLQLCWSLLLHTCQAALEDQSQLDFEARGDTGRGRKKKATRRRKVVNKVTHAEDEDDEYVEGFD